MSLCWIAPRATQKQYAESAQGLLFWKCCPRVWFSTLPACSVQSTPSRDAYKKCAVVHLVEPKAAAVTASGPECNAATFIVFLDGCFILPRDILKLGQSMPGDIFKLRWPCTVAPNLTRTTGCIYKLHIVGCKRSQCWVALMLNSV